MDATSRIMLNAIWLGLAWLGLAAVLVLFGIGPPAFAEAVLTTATALELAVLVLLAIVMAGWFSDWRAEARP